MKFSLSRTGDKTQAVAVVYSQQRLPALGAVADTRNVFGPDFVGFVQMLLPFFVLLLILVVVTPVAFDTETLAVDFVV